MESKRQKKIPPPRPPPPNTIQAISPPADPRPRNYTVSGDMPRRPRHPPCYTARHGGSPVIEKKPAADPVPPPRRRKKQQLGFPDSNSSSNHVVKEGSTNTKEDSCSLASKRDVPDGGTIDTKRQEAPLINGGTHLEVKEKSAKPLSISSARPSTQRKEAQNLAKMKVSVNMHACMHGSLAM